MGGGGGEWDFLDTKCSGSSTLYPFERQVYGEYCLYIFQPNYKFEYHNKIYIDVFILVEIVTKLHGNLRTKHNNVWNSLLKYVNGLM